MGFYFLQFSITKYSFNIYKMFYFLKDIINHDDVKKFSVSHNHELEQQMIELYDKYYDHVTTKYPFNKKLSDEEFKHLAKGVFIALVSSCLSEEASKKIDLYHLYIIKLCYTFCVTRGFHIDDQYAEYLDKIMTDLVDSELNLQIIDEFNKSKGPDDTPLCDSYMYEKSFIGQLYRQDIRLHNKTGMITDLKRFKYENLEIFNFFLIADNFIESNQKINLIYRKYVKWCKKWLRPEEPEEEDEDDEAISE